MKKSSIALATSLLAGGLLTACGSSGSSVAADCKPAHEFKTLHEGKLTVAAYDLPPFAKIERQGLTGVDGDILKEIAEMECLELEVQSSSAAAIIPSIQAGRVDLGASAWYRTAERAEVVDLTEPLYTDQMAIIDADGTSAIPDLQGKKVGTVDGYLWVDDLKDYLGGDLKIYSQPLNLYQDLKAGRISVAVDSYGSGVFNTEGDDYEVTVAEEFDEVAASLEGAQTTFPIPKGNEDMLAALNADIAELRSNGRLAEIMEENGLDASAAEPGESRLIGD